MTFKHLNIIILFLLHTSNQAFGQVISRDFATIMSKGNTPTYFIGANSQKYTANKSINKKHKSNKQKDDLKKLMQNDYLIDELLESGKVLFGDTTTEYCNRIKELLLKENPELNARAKIYVVKSAKISSFSVNSGFIFITTALIARLQSEAQLAFIIGHELGHLSAKHFINFGNEPSKMYEIDGKLTNKSIEERLLSRTPYALNQELEADAFSAKLYLTAKYDVNEIVKLFDVIKGFSFPIYNSTFDFAFLNSKYVIVPEFNLTKEIKMNVVDENYSNEDTILVQIGLRKSTVLNFINSKNQNDGKLINIISEEIFNYSSMLCKYEQVRLLNINREYIESLYLNFELQKIDTSSNFLIREYLKSLYCISKYTTGKRGNEVRKNEGKVSGQIHALYYWANNTRGKEFCIITSVKLWEYHLKNPKNPEYVAWCNDLLNDIATIHFTDKNFFYRFKPKDSILYKKYDINDSYFDRNEYLKYAYADYFSDTAFNKAFLSAYFINEETNKQKVKFLKTKSRKIVIDQAKYLVIDGRKDNKIDLINSALKKDFLTKVIIKVSKNSKLPIYLLNSESFVEDGADALNNHNILSEYIAEKNLHDEIPIILHLDSNIIKIKEYYETPYFSYPGVVNFKKKNKDGFKQSLLLLFPLTAPIGFAKLQSGKNLTIIYNFTYNLDNGKRYSTDISNIRLRDRKDVITSVIEKYIKKLALQ